MELHCYAVCCNETKIFVIEIALEYAESKLSSAEWCHGTKFPLATFAFRNTLRLTSTELLDAATDSNVKRLLVHSVSLEWGR